MLLKYKQGPAATAAAILLPGLLLSACAGAPPPEAYRQNVFLDGKLNLDCTEFACAVRWRMKADEVRAHYAGREWKSLATAVASTQYGSDLAYFYLGRAAEGMHRYRAAQHYFEQALTTPERCAAGVFSACDGIDLPAAALRHGERIARLLGEAPMDLVVAQTRLAELGLYTAAIDGISGPRTRAAIRQFQERRNMAVSGQLDAVTSAVLTEAAAEVEAPPAQIDSAAVESVTPVPEDTSQDDGIGVAAPPTSAPLTATRTRAPLAASVQAAGTKSDGADGDTDTTGLRRDDGATEAVAAEGAATASGRKVAKPVATPGRTPAATVNTARTEGADMPHTRSRVTIEVELLSDADPFAEVVAVVTQGAWVDIIDRGNEWSKISHQDKTGFVYTDFLK